MSYPIDVPIVTLNNFSTDNKGSRKADFEVMNKLPFTSMCFMHPAGHSTIVSYRNEDGVDSYQLIGLDKFCKVGTIVFFSIYEGNPQIDFSLSECYLDQGVYTNGWLELYVSMRCIELTMLVEAIHQGTEAKFCKLTDKQKSINAKRVKNGKKPIYDFKTIKIKPSVYYKPTGATRDSIRSAHQRRGHFRNLQSGKKVWVKDCKVSEGHMKPVKYVFEYE